MANQIQFSEEKVNNFIKTRNFRCTRISKCIWVINGIRLDVRKNVPCDNGIFNDSRNTRKAIMLYAAQMDSSLNLPEVDLVACRLINQQVQKVEVLDSLVVILK